MSYLATILASHPKLFLRLGEASGATVAVDATANGDDGAYHGGVTLGATGALTRDANTAATLNGTTGRIQVPHAAAINPATAMTIEVWAQPTASVANKTIAWKEAGGAYWYARMRTNTDLDCSVNSDGTSVIAPNVIGASDYGVWTHLVFTYDGAAVRIYKNGSLVFGPTASTGISANTGDLHVGVLQSGGFTQFVDSGLDEFALYDYALTATQIATHYAARTLPDYAHFLTTENPDFVILVEPQLMESLAGWTAAGGGLANTYYCSFNDIVGTAPTTLYRRLDFVRQDGTTLTSRASAALVDANLGSYFYDTANDRIYVATTSGLSPDVFALVGAWFTLPLATNSVALPDAPLYYPIVTGDLPALVQEKPDALFGASVDDTGAVSLMNSDGLFDTLSKRWVWRNKPVTFKLGGGSLAYSEFATIGTLRINSVQVDDEICRMQLESIGSVLNRSIPPNTWGDGTAPGPFSSTEDILSQSQPWLFGVAKDCRLPLTNTGTYGSYQPVGTVFASALGVSDVPVPDAVYAVHRTTGARVTLTSGTDYGYSGTNLITINNATYTYTDYEIWADLRMLSGPLTVGAILQKLLRLLGVALADIDTAAFAAVDVAAPQSIGVYLTEPVHAADIVRVFEQSVSGQVYRDVDGRWTMRLFDPSSPASYTLADADFAQWTLDEELQGVLNEVRVNYAARHASGSASQASSSDDTVLYASETSDNTTIDTYLRTAADASVLAQRTRFLKGSPAARVQFTERGLTLLAASVGDLVAVTRDRGPVARTGRLDGQLFEIVRLKKSLGGEGGPTVDGVLEDLGGQTDRIARYSDGASPVDWATATAAQKAIYGFYCDGNGYIDPADPLTKHAKVAC